ncbi:C-type lectin domain family 4 member M-like [Archocentrus centrarchus]|uniref:C-type lectin domain family 4 member M-like n=1 Tax=Archocentrus centrarchus TaxID=63155 RepID=UPI0011E9FD04|nr:C-type lectin domain family 4 member M-like [Archocentrus centrarchus]
MEYDNIGWSLFQRGISTSKIWSGQGWCLPPYCSNLPAYGSFNRTVRMEVRREPVSNFSGGFETHMCEEHVYDEEPPPYLQSNRHQASMFTVRSGRRNRMAAVSLVLLAVVLLILDVGLGVHYSELTDTHLTLDDTKRISKQLAGLQDTYKAAVETMKDARKQLDSETSRQTQTNWALEHQTKRSNDYKSQIETITKEIETMRSHLRVISDGCKHCPAGWIFMNSVCYYFSLKSDQMKTWKESREFCQLQGGDLIIINSKDEENSTVNYLMNHHDARRQTRDLFDEDLYDFYGEMHNIYWQLHNRHFYEEEEEEEIEPVPVGFWIGLRGFQEEGTWKWWDGTFLTEGYWSDGEPNDTNNENCAAVYPRENFFKTWNDVRCDAQMKWICEKAPVSMS